MRTKLSLFTLKFLAKGAEKVNAVGLKSKVARHDNLNFGEKVKYLDNLVVDFQDNV